jgi:hypothetical protein
MHHSTYRLPFFALLVAGVFCRPLAGAEEPAEDVEQVAAPSEEDVPLTEAQAATYRRVGDDTSTLEGFHLVGWVRDENGLTVVLRNTTQRYVYHGNRLRYNRDDGDEVQSFQASITGQNLMLQDQRRNKIVLALTPDFESRRR